MENEPLDILLVEDVNIYVSLLERMLASFEVRLITAGTLSEGIEKTKNRKFDAVLLDLGLPDSSGLNTFTVFQEQFPDMPVVILSGLDDERMAARAVQMGAQDYLVKGPYLTKGEAGRDLLFRSLRYAVERQQIQDTLLRERDLLEDRVAERTTELKQANEQLLQELAERKRIEKALRSSEAQNQALINAMPDLICRVDQNGKVLDLKIPTTFSDVIPHPERFIGSPFNKVFPANVVEQVEKNYHIALERQQTQVFEDELSVGDQHYNIEFRIVVDQEAGIMVLMRDVTESKALERMWRRYEFIANTSKDLLTLINRQYRFQAVNDAFCASQGKSRDEILGKTVAEIRGETSFETRIKGLLDSGFLGEEKRYEGWLNYGVLGRRYFEVNYYPFVNQVGSVTHVVVISRDETERKQAEDKLRRYYQRLDILREIDRATLAVRSPEAIGRVALRHIQRLVPYDQSDILLFEQKITQTGSLIEEKGEWVTVLARRSSQMTLRRGERFPLGHIQFFKRLTDGKNYLVDDLQEAKNLSPFEERLERQGVRSFFMIPLSAEGKLIGGISLGSQSAGFFTGEHVNSASEMARQLALMLYNAQLFEQLRSGRERLRYLTSQLVSAQEDERSRISLELHDEAGQALTALKLNLALIRDSLPQELANIRNQMAEAISLTESTMNQVRSLAHNLRPPALDAVGLNQTMKDYCKRIARQTDLQMEYNGVDIPELPGHYQSSLYRVLQESLTNVIKHAQATQVSVELRIEEKIVYLQIADNGKGFIYQAASSDPKKGIGLMGIEERMEALGGTMEIFSQPGHGTILQVQVPLQSSK